MKPILVLLLAVGVACDRPDPPAASRPASAPRADSARPAVAAPSITRRVDSLISVVIPSPDTVDSFPDAAVNRRFRMRREAIASMQSELLAFVVAESAFQAEHGYWTDDPTQKYFDWERFSRGGNLPVERIATSYLDGGPEVEGWWVTFSNRYTDFMCTLYVGRPEMVFPGAREGVPFCRPDSIPGVSNQPPPYRRIRTLRENPPPGTEWNLDVNCVGKGCELGPLTACVDVVVRREANPASGPLFTWPKGEQRRATFAQVQVKTPGLVTFRGPAFALVQKDSLAMDTLRFTPADTIYPMAERADGLYFWYYRRKLWLGPRFWGQETGSPVGNAVLVRGETLFWPVVIQATSGEEGYIQPTRALVAGLHPKQGDSWDRCGSTLVAKTALFTFYADPWINLHHFLYEWSRVERGLPTTFGEAGIAERNHTPSLSEDQRRAWGRAVAFYRNAVASRSELDDAMVREKEGLAALAGNPNAPPPDEIPGIAEALRTAMPIYRSTWLVEHERSNRNFAEDQMLLLHGQEQRIVEILERTYGVKWPSSSVRVDLSYYSNTAGGYATDHEILTFTSDWFGDRLHPLEALLRSLQNTSLVVAARAAMEKAFQDAGVRQPPNLWDGMVHATAGEIVRSIVASREVPGEYRPYWISLNFADSTAWKAIVPAVQDLWLPVVRGEKAREEGYAALVKRFGTNPR